MSENKCLVCQFDNREENIFCTKCGQKLIEDVKGGARLLVLSSKKTSITHHINPGRSTIGRDIGNALVLNDEQISKYHAAIVYEEGILRIEDLESKNGVFVEGRKITNRTILPDGCLIKLGSTMLKYENGDS